MSALRRVRRGVAGRTAHFARRARKSRRAVREKWVIATRWRRRGGPEARRLKDLISGLYGLDRCDVIYINLDARTDRREQIERDLAEIGVRAFCRFPAIANRRGSIGCARSHEEVLKNWEPANGKMLLVLEDDCEFLAGRVDLDKAVEEFATSSSLAVLCLANETKWAFPISRRLAISANIQTTAAYVVKPHVRQELVEAFDESACRLSAGEDDSTAACDVVWKRIQATRFFAVPRRRLIRQRPGFSDVGGSWVPHRG